MTELGRRIIFDKTTGKVLIDFGESRGSNLVREPIGELDYIDLELGAHADEFARARAYHIDPTTREVVFDELIKIQPTYEELQQKLLEAQGVI